jgi:putative ABC transport system permease protein
VFGKLLPLPVMPALHPDELALSFIYGLLTALAFGLWPLGGCTTCRWRRCFARRSHANGIARAGLSRADGGVIALLIAVAIGLAYDKRVAAVFVAPRSWCSRCCAASPPA